MTQADDGFAEYAEVMLWSVRQKNPALDADCIVLTHPSLCPLSAENRTRLEKVWPGVRFQDVDDGPYRRFFTITPPRLHAALLKLEIFRLQGYEKVLFIDADILCMGNLAPLMNLTASFAAAPAGKNRGSKELRKNRMVWRTSLNSGVMLIGEKYRTGKTYAKMIGYHMQSCPTADQDIINRYFRFRPFFCLDHRYNYHAQFFWDGTETDISLLHYAGEKPLQKPDAPRMQPWFAARKSMHEAR